MSNLILRLPYAWIDTTTAGMVRVPNQNIVQKACLEIYTLSNNVDSFQTAKTEQTSNVFVVSKLFYLGDLWHIACIEKAKKEFTMLRNFLLFFVVSLISLPVTAKPLTQVHPSLSLKHCYPLNKALPTFGNLGALVSAALKVTVDNPGMDPMVFQAYINISGNILNAKKLLQLRNTALHAFRYAHKSPQARRHLVLEVTQYIKRCKHTDVAKTFLVEFEKRLSEYSATSKSGKGRILKCKIVPGCRTDKDPKWGLFSDQKSRSYSKKCFKSVKCKDCCKADNPLYGFIHRRVLQGIPIQEIQVLFALAKARIIKHVDADQLVETWRKTWEQSAKLNHVRRLRKLYHPEFRHLDARMGRSRYMKRLAKGARKYRFWRVQVGQVRVTKRSMFQMVTTFQQKYSRPGYRDHGVKTLVWRQYDRDWLVYRESWKALPKTYKRAQCLQRLKQMARRSRVLQAYLTIPQTHLTLRLNKKKSVHSQGANRTQRLKWFLKCAVKKNQCWPTSQTKPGVIEYHSQCSDIVEGFTLSHIQAPTPAAVVYIWSAMMTSRYVFLVKRNGRWVDTSSKRPRPSRKMRRWMKALNPNSGCEYSGVRYSVQPASKTVRMFATAHCNADRPPDFWLGTFRWKKGQWKAIKLRKKQPHLKK